MSKKFWSEAEALLYDRYGEEPPIELIERLESERLAYPDSDDFENAVRVVRILRREAEQEQGDIFCRGLFNNFFVAWLYGATKDNPLPAHYYCPTCKKVEFRPEVPTGWDLPEKTCSCGSKMERDGHGVSHKIHPWSRFTSMEIGIPSSFQFRAKEILQEFYGETNDNVVEVHIGRDQVPMRYVLLNKHIHPEATNGDVLYLDADEFHDRFFSEMYYCFSCSGILDLIQSCAKGSGSKPTQADLLQDKTIDAFKKAGSFRSYIDYLVYERNRIDDVLGFERAEDAFNTLRYYMDNYECDGFSDLLCYEGLTHNTYEPSNAFAGEMLEQLKPGEVIAFRDDVLDHICQALKDKGIEGDAIAIRISEDVRKGLYADGGMPPHIRKTLQAIDISEEYISALEHIRYLFPRGHCVDYLRLLLTAAWYAVHEPAVYLECFERFCTLDEHEDTEKRGMKYQAITKYRKQLQRSSFGTWVKGHGKGTAEDPLRPGYFRFDEDVREFLHAVIEMNTDNKKCIETFREIGDKDVQDMLEDELFAVLAVTIAGERFGEGGIQSALESGYFQDILERLEKLDIMDEKK